MNGFERREERVVDAENVWADDAFQTLEQYATFLTNALTANTKNFVLNVNGSWGTGKSFFVQRWAEALRQQNYPVVEFNAWENDSAEDPLAPLIAAVMDQQKDLLPAPMAKKMKESCGKFLLAGGGLIVRAGLKHLVGEKGMDEVNNLLSSGAENELIKLAGNYVDEQLEKQKASEGLKEVLGSFVEGIEADDGHELPIFIFIDELDRCCPSFAIELLERVKHLFNVDGIKFIISTDSEQLSHSIRGAYGEQFEGHVYLQRFFDEVFSLPDPDAFQFANLLFSNVGNLWKDCWIVENSPQNTFAELATQFKLTLRQQHKAHHRVIAVVENIPASPENKLHFIYICILVMIRLKYPDDYRRLMTYAGKSQVWENIKTERRIGTTHVRLADDYFLLMDLSIEEVAGLSERIKGNPNRDNLDHEKSRFYLCRQCIEHNNAFKKYPQLVELTETLS